MKRTRTQKPKAAQDPQDTSAAAAANPAPTPKPQRKAKQPRQPKAAGAGGKKATAAAARQAAAAAVAATAASSASAAAPNVAEMAPVVPDVCGGGGGAEVAGSLPADWDEMDGGLGSNGSPWWTFGGVEEEKLLGWFPFVEEDFVGGCHGAGGRGEHEAAAAGFDDDIWRIHQIYEIPSYAAK